VGTTRGSDGSPGGGIAHAIDDEHQRAFYESFGFMVYPGLFADEVDELSAAFDDAFADPAMPRICFTIPGHHGRPRIATGDLIERDPRMRRLRDDPRILGVVDRLVGPESTYMSSDGNIYRCESEWHVDTVPAVDRRAIKLLLYLEPIGATSGALRVMPGSHRSNARTDTLAPYLGFDGPIGPRMGIGGHQLPHWALESTPGDLVVIDFSTAHSSYGALTDRRKIALNFFYPTDRLGPPSSPPATEASATPATR
jgi:hypothetical protein